MELCTCGAISSALPNPKLIVSPTRLNPSLSISTYNSGRSYLLKTSLRATSSEETSTGLSQYTVEEPVTKNGYKAAEKKMYVGSETVEKEEYTEDTPTDEQAQAFEFLDNLDAKLDSGDTSSVLLLGGGSLIAFWIATVLVGSIDSIPLVFLTHSGSAPAIFFSRKTERSWLLKLKKLSSRSSAQMAMIQWSSVFLTDVCRVRLCFMLH